MTAAIAATRRSLPDQWTGGPLGWRAWSRRAVDSHRPGARSRCRGDRGILPGLQPASVSSAVRRFQGRLAGDFASGLNWNAGVRRCIGPRCPLLARPRIHGPRPRWRLSGVLRSPARRSKRGRERGPASGFSAVKLPSVARKHPSPQCGATGAARLDPLPRWRRQAVRKRLVQWPVGSAMQSKRSNPGLRPGLPHASLLTKTRYS